MTHQDWAKEREEFQQMIAGHIAAGTCYLCNQPVAEGERRHGVTGAHCDCANGLPHPAVRRRQGGVSLARLPKGSVLHIVDRSTKASRCGAGNGAPASRESWVWCDTSAARYEICAKCVTLGDDDPIRN